ncbi:MAG: hypothetical protein J7J02_04430 [Sulfurovum sp.]|nr:hypothetical protein [Sulfurovum sp.]
MRYTKTLITSTAIAAGFLLSACTSSALPPLSGGNAYIYNGINFGSDRDASFKHGVRDGCRTSDGDYTKDHNLFNNSESYKTGWEDGRLQCHGK